MPRDTGLGANGALFVERMDSVLKEKGILRRELAAKCGISLQAISNWSHRGTIPAADIALKIAECLDVTVEWLVLGTNPLGFTEDEESVVRGYKNIPPEAKRAVHALIESFN